MIFILKKNHIIYGSHLEVKKLPLQKGSFMLWSSSTVVNVRTQKTAYFHVNVVEYHFSFLPLTNFESLRITLNLDNKQLVLKLEIYFFFSWHRTIYVRENKNTMHAFLSSLSKWNGWQEQAWNTCTIWRGRASKNFSQHLWTVDKNRAERREISKGGGWWVLKNCRWISEVWSSDLEAIENYHLGAEAWAPSKTSLLPFLGFWF